MKQILFFNVARGSWCGAFCFVYEISNMDITQLSLRPNMTRALTLAIV